MAFQFLKKTHCGPDHVQGQYGLFYQLLGDLAQNSIIQFSIFPFSCNSFVHDLGLKVLHTYYLLFVQVME